MLREEDKLRSMLPDLPSSSDCATKDGITREECTGGNADGEPNGGREPGDGSGSDGSGTEPGDGSGCGGSGPSVGSEDVEVAKQMAVVQYFRVSFSFTLHSLTFSSHSLTRPLLSLSLSLSLYYPSL